jgi:hypothetical protein
MEADPVFEQHWWGPRVKKRMRKAIRQSHFGGKELVRGTLWRSLAKEGWKSVWTIQRP